MIYSVIFVLISSSLASTSSLFCQDSSLCNNGSKQCQDPTGQPWCCKKKAVLCDENNQCSFTVAYLPFIRLRPGTTESESSYSEERMYPKSKHLSKKSKFALGSLLSYHCERLDSHKAIEVIDSVLETPSWKTNVSDINCPGRKQRCPPENTCCLIGEQKYGCCRYSEAVCCADLIHCCPPDTDCNVETLQCTKKNSTWKMELLR